jgi:hypothetical protein
MIKSLWTYFALVFSGRMSYYGLTLPERTRDERMVLIFDGQKSGLNLTAALMIDSCFLSVIDSSFRNFVDFCLANFIDSCITGFIDPCSLTSY